MENRGTAVSSARVTVATRDRTRNQIVKALARPLD